MTEVWLDIHGDLHGRGIEGASLAEKQHRALELAVQGGILHGPAIIDGPGFEVYGHHGRIIIETPSHPMDPPPGGGPHGSDPARG